MGTRRVSKESHISDVSKNGDKDPTYTFKTKKIPDDALYVLAYSKNSHAEHPVPASWKIIDNHRPCLNASAVDCPAKVTVSSDTDSDPNQVAFTIDVGHAQDKSYVTHYALHWARKDKSEAILKHGHIHDLPVDISSHVLAENTAVPPASTHIMACSKNQYGESNQCVSTDFIDSGTPI